VGIRGKVAPGLGEGRYYISREGYRRQFSEKLGFDPSPGTLNLKLDDPFTLDDSGSIEIEGFSEEGRSFGGCRCLPAEIGGVKGAVVRPERSSYPSTLLEIIAPVNLREALSLSDGDEVEMVLGSIKGGEVTLLPSAEDRSTGRAGREDGESI
jgi:riboflavin kinase